PKHGKKAPLSNPDQSGGKHHESEGDVRVHGSVETYPPPSVIQKHDSERKEDSATHQAERKEDRGRESKKLLLEVLTLIAVVVYAGIAFWQGCLTRESIDNNGRQFQIDQRPYLWTTNTDP